MDVIDFMPLSSVNYSGGIIITDWYSTNENQNESIKISIRFLTNEIRSDALNIKIFTRKCEINLNNCSFTETNKVLVSELTKEILKKLHNWRCISSFQNTSRFQCFTPDGMGLIWYASRKCCETKQFRSKNLD